MCKIEKTFKNHIMKFYITEGSLKPAGGGDLWVIRSGAGGRTGPVSGWSGLMCPELWAVPCGVCL